MEKYISKVDGTEEVFDEEKIRTSLLNAGTDPDIVDATTSRIKKNLNEIIKSQDIYKLALEHLKQNQPAAAIKYTLKKAIMDLGPTGYIFEKYFARVLEAHGFKAEVGRIVRGYCVEHEVDVVVEKDDSHYMVECKYHNDPGTKSDVKTSLYIHARFLDILKACDEGLNDYSFNEAWLATNTKCTTEAIKYASCVKMRIIAWHYPRNENLEYHIESKKIYPVSILSDLKEYQKNKLFDNDILTIQDLLKNTPDSIAKDISTNQLTANRLFAEAALLLS